MTGTFRLTRSLGRSERSTLRSGRPSNWWPGCSFALPWHPRSVGVAPLIWVSLDGTGTAKAPSTLGSVVLIFCIVATVLLAVALRRARQVAPAERRAERQIFELALQSETEGIWEWDIPTDAIVRSAPSFIRLGYPSGEQFTLMQHWLSIVHPADREQVQVALAAHLAARSSGYEAQYQVESASGRWHTFVERGRVVTRNKHGKPLRFLGTFADVTDRKSDDEQRRQVEMTNTIALLAARIAHEINNPLAGIRNSFLLIRDAIPPKHPHFRYVGAIEREVERISQVTRQLYETYRVEAEPARQSPAQSVISDAVMFMEQVNQNSGVTVMAELSPASAFVRLSDTMLRQCVCSVIQHAIDASGSGSRVVIRGETELGDFVMRITAAGAGVPAAMHNGISDPFIAVKSSQIGGGRMGLGLAELKRAVDAAGGSVYVTDAPDGGGEFVIRLALADSSPMGVT